MLKRLGLLMAVAAVVVLAAGGAEAKAKKITSEADFVSIVVGKTLVNDEKNVVVIAANGGMTGKIGGQKITAGGWKWNGKKFCRTLKTAQKEFPSACQDVTLDGSTITFGPTAWKIQ